VPAAQSGVYLGFVGYAQQGAYGYVELRIHAGHYTLLINGGVVAPVPGRSGLHGGREGVFVPPRCSAVGGARSWVETWRQAPLKAVGG
jgi:hypothetical protein